MVMAQSLLSLLRLQHPSARIAVMAPAWSVALLERMPEVDEIIESPFRHGELKLLARYRLGRQLAGRFDRAIVLPNSFKSALLPRFAGIPRRTGWRGEFRNLLLSDCRKLDPQQFPLMVQRFVALGVDQPDPLPAYQRPALQVNRDQALCSAAELGLNYSGRILALCPGAEFGEAKQWPLAHYAGLCELAAADDWQFWVMGSVNDRQAAQELLSQLRPETCNRVRDLTGSTSLGQAIDLLSLATAAVTNDSGLMHIGAAVGCPLITLFGSTSPDFTPPLTDRVKSLSIDLACRPCFKRRCPLGHKRCLTDIMPERVYESLQELLPS
ncbi:MAG: lipopolysaccharide heptosyltransferase II [Pseudomonadales bacterium]|nr:lipopolysaccharide heptosyltransferase II [Pseudomonadales bacterium]MCP5347587.1 lipopolysaccharide heptosyltransferase II [Pseudomonadales bacterium]